MIEAKDWIPITERMPPQKEEVLWLYEYGEKPIPGVYHSYDGKWVVISMRNWSIHEPLFEFTHWTPLPTELPDHPSYRPPSDPHHLSEESPVSLGDGDAHRATPSGDDSALGVVEDLNDPPVRSGPQGIEINGEPETLFQAAGVESGEKFGGLKVENPGGHAPPGGSEGFLKYVTETVGRLRVVFELEYTSEYLAATDALNFAGDIVSSKSLESNDFMGIAGMRERWKVEAVRRFAARLLKEFQSSGPRFAS